jgi:hypothetical protein
MPSLLPRSSAPLRLLASAPLLASHFVIHTFQSRTMTQGV